MKASVVVLGWNEYPLFTRHLDRIHEELPEAEMIFVDNGSDDGTKDWVPPEWVNCIRLPENTGTGHGFNVGFDAAQGMYILYFSGDMLTTKGSLVAMIDYLDTHDDVDFLLINPWVAQGEVEDPAFGGFEHEPRQGMGNYAGSYAIFRRKILDVGCRMADTSIFAGAGCGYEEAEFASAMYSKGFRCFVFNKPTYFHQQRNFKRSGHPEGDLQRILEERRRFLKIRWPEQDYGIVYHQVPNQPPPRHIRKVAVIYKASDVRPGPGGSMVEALNEMCFAEHFEHGEEPEGWDDYLYVDNGDYNFDYYNPLYKPNIFWAIDMTPPQQAWRPNLDAYVEAGKRFDRVFAAQKKAVAYFEEHGVHARWLPLAASPSYCPRAVQEPIYDVASIWHHCGDRIPLIEELGKLGSWKHLRGYFDGTRYAEKMGEARAILNLSRSNEVTLRVFEAMAVGRLLVTDEGAGMRDIFPSDCYLSFPTDSIQDAAASIAQKLNWMLECPQEAKRIADRGYEEFIKKHTYLHRALQMFGDYGGERDLFLMRY